MKEKLCGVYCIENIQNKRKYIGISRNIQRRWIEHKSNLNNHKHNNFYLQKSWEKYGSENFNFYIIELCSEQELSEKERYYIKLYKTLSHEHGYNLTPGGENTSIGKMVICLKDDRIYNYVKEASEYEGVTPATMTSWCRNKQKYMYLDEYNALSNEDKLYWQNYDWETVKHDKLSKAHSRENLSDKTIDLYKMTTRGSNNPRAFKIYCPQLDEYFDCAKYASDKYGISRSGISSCINGKLKSSGIHPVTHERLTWIKV